MKCLEINSWINNASDTELNLLPETVSEHVQTCETCAAKVMLVQQSFGYMTSQKQETLSEEKTRHIIESLLAQKTIDTSKNFNGKFIISRVAAVLIIAFGLLVGIVAGGLLFGDSNSDVNPWSNEFTLLSQNTEYILFE